ncbi:hypothetical protein BSLG_003006 [Batrachochytrium salamandrivorans]|nr:hypothetical protein BSLG_003006 [Batrachochytrium salamandrivorans]
MGKSYTSTPAKSTKSHSAKKAAAMASANTPTVRSACYSGVIVYEVKARNNVPVMRRKSAIALAEAYKVGDELRTLFEYDTKSGEAEKHVVARVKRSAPIATRREAGGDSSNDSSSEETADEDDNTHRDREVITGGRTARTAAITKAAAYRSLSTPKRLIQEGAGRGSNKHGYDSISNRRNPTPNDCISPGRRFQSTLSDMRSDRHTSMAPRLLCKRTLYNACDAKWSSDRLASHSASPTGNRKMSISSDSDSVDSSSLSSPLGELDLEVGSTAWSLSLEVQGLKMKLRDMERGQQRLRKLLLEAKIDDRDIDRGYRKVIHAAKRSRSDDDGDIYGWEGDFSHDDRVPQQLEENDSGDACGDSYPRGFSEMESQNRCSRSAVLTASKVSRRFNNESERDRQHEQLAIGRFVRAVKRSKSKMMDRIRSMRLPLQPLS